MLSDIQNSAKSAVANASLALIVQSYNYMQNLRCTAEAKLIREMNVPKIVLQLQRDQDLESRFYDDIGTYLAYVVELNRALTNIILRFRLDFTKATEGLPKKYTELKELYVSISSIVPQDHSAEPTVFLCYPENDLVMKENSVDFLFLQYFSTWQQN